MISPWLRWRGPLDRAAAAVLSLVVAPIVAVLAVLIGCTSGVGRPLIRLPRAGRGGSTIRVCKLRTMRTETRDGVAAGPPLTRGEDDDRISSIGRVLRRHRLDELPQVWNVLAGDMALIGPRPEALDYVEGDDPRWRMVLSARPGIAGPTQLLVEHWERMALQGETFEQTYVDEILPVKLAIDQWYLRAASPAVDLMVVRALISRFAFGRAPSALRRHVRAAVPEVERIPAAASE